ncbi:MAG: (2Fe-2S)-binding protein [Treponema sp.]|nr:(2Fe-2S)-binding protein [Treponema sp.]
MDKNKIACECRRITYGKIEEAVKNGAENFEQIIESTGAGKSCGNCKDFIKYLTERFLEELKE